LIWLFGWAPPQRIEKTITQGMDRAQAKRVLDEGRKINTSCARLISGSSHLRDGLFVCFVLAEMYRCFGGDVPMSRLFLPRNNVSRVARLLALGNVIAALAKRRPGLHVPYPPATFYFRRVGFASWPFLAQPAYPASDIGCGVDWMLMFRFRA
jgi:hypothetical protein